MQTLKYTTATIFNTSMKYVLIKNRITLPLTLTNFSFKQTWCRILPNYAITNFRLNKHGAGYYSTNTVQDFMQDFMQDLGFYRTVPTGTPIMLSIKPSTFSP